MRAERRQFERVRRKLRVRYGQDGLDMAGLASDVSLGGLFLTGRRSFPVGTRLHLHVMHSDGDLYAEGLVVRQKVVDPRLQAIERSGMGIRILSPMEALGHLVESRHAPKPKKAVVTEAAGAYEVVCRTPEAVHTLIREQLSAGIVWLPIGSNSPKPATTVEFWIHLRFGDERTIHAEGRVIQLFDAQAGPHAVIQVEDPHALQAALGY